GRNVVFLVRAAGVTQLWVRALDSFQPHPLVGTDDAYGAFWSPDSRNIGFFAQGKLRRIAAAGGPALILCDVDQARGGSWNRQGIILFAKYPGEINRIPASGGTPQQVTHLDLSRHDTSHKWPYFLPDGNHFLYMASTLGTASDENVIFAGSLDGNADRILFHRTYSSGVFSASGTGMLLYQTGNASSERKLDLLDASGKTLSPLSAPLSSSEAQVSPDGKPVAYVLMDVNNGGARISPDGKRVAHVLLDSNSGKADIWIYDIASGNRTRLTIDPVLSQFPVWSHDGTKIAYSSTR